jgi:hypothetical protein
MLNWCYRFQRMSPHLHKHRVESRKWRLPRQEFVKRAAQAVNVGPDIYRVTIFALLRCYIVKRCQELAIGGDTLTFGRTRLKPGEAKIDQLYRLPRVSREGSKVRCRDERAQAHGCAEDQLKPGELFRATPLSAKDHTV